MVWGMLAKELRKARKETGMTQEQLAAASGLDVTYISQIERGLRNPSLDVFFRLCKGLQIRPRTLIARLEKAMGWPREA